MQKLTLLVPELFRAEGGIARISRLYLQALAESAPNQTLNVIVLNDAALRQSDLNRYGAAASTTVACDRSKWRCLLALARVTTGANHRIVCTHVHLTPVLWMLRALGRRFRYEVVLHGIEVWDALPWHLRRGLSSASRILCVSAFTRDAVLSRYPHLAAKMVILPNALDPSFVIEPVQSTPGMPTVLAVSRLAPHDVGKGIDHLIAAFPKVVAHVPNAQLRIIGEGPDRVRLEALAAQSSARDHITFLGFQPESELKAELGRCTVFALPSRKEGFGLVYLEAMAAGKPCIVAAAGGAPEVIDENSGLIVPYGEPDQLASAVLQALKREWSPSAICARASEFSYETFAKRWRQLPSLSTA